MKALPNQKQRLCDYCNELVALLYCRADSAKLCFSCDRQVHSTNPLFVKHSRSHLCDACDESPASIFCETDSWVLCHNCDWETHKPSQSPPHNRRPIEGFSGCPSVTELLGFVGFEDLGNKALIMREEKGESGVNGDVSVENGFDGLLNLFVCEAPSLDDIIVFNGSNHGLRAMDIPPLPKYRNITCGQYKMEVLCQLRELAKTEANLNNENASIEASIDWFQSLMPDCYLEPKDTYAGHEYDATVPISLPAQELRALKGFGDSNEVVDNVLPSPLPICCHEENAMVPNTYVNTGGHSSHQICNQDDQPLDAVASGTSLNVKVPLYELNSQERETAISRYKEKKKTRRYEKQIRYESRKVRAEGRTRIKGRFAKVDP